EDRRLKALSAVAGYGRIKHMFVRRSGSSAIVRTSSIAGWLPIAVAMLMPPTATSRGMCHSSAQESRFLSQAHGGRVKFKANRAEKWMRTSNNRNIDPRKIDVNFVF